MKPWTLRLLLAALLPLWGACTDDRGPAAPGAPNGSFLGMPIPDVPPPTLVSLRVDRLSQGQIQRLHEEGRLPESALQGFTPVLIDAYASDRPGFLADPLNQRYVFGAGDTLVIVLLWTQGTGADAAQDANFSYGFAYSGTTHLATAPLLNVNFGPVDFGVPSVVIASIEIAFPVADTLIDWAAVGTFNDGPPSPPNIADQVGVSYIARPPLVFYGPNDNGLPPGDDAIGREDGEDGESRPWSFTMTPGIHIIPGVAGQTCVATGPGVASVRVVNPRTGVVCDNIQIPVAAGDRCCQVAQALQAALIARGYQVGRLVPTEDNDCRFAITRYPPAVMDCAKGVGVKGKPKRNELQADDTVPGITVSVYP